MLNDYHARDGWSIEFIDGKYYFCSFDAGHSGEDYQIEVSKEELEYAHLCKPTFEEMYERMYEKGFTK